MTVLKNKLRFDFLTTNEKDLLNFFISKSYNPSLSASRDKFINILFFHPFFKYLFDFKTKF